MSTLVMLIMFCGENRDKPKCQSPTMDFSIILYGEKQLCYFTLFIFTGGYEAFPPSP